MLSDSLALEQSQVTQMFSRLSQRAAAAAGSHFLYGLPWQVASAVRLQLCLCCATPETADTPMPLINSITFFPSRAKLRQRILCSWSYQKDHLASRSYCFRALHVIVASGKTCLFMTSCKQAPVLQGDFPANEDAKKEEEDEKERGAGQRLLCKGQ